jgi:hypothetical protein
MLGMGHVTQVTKLQILPLEEMQFAEEYLSEYVNPYYDSGYFHTGPIHAHDMHKIKTYWKPRTDIFEDGKMLLYFSYEIREECFCGV